MTEKMKPSGITWIGDIPSEWEAKKIKYVISDIKDGTHGTFDRVESGELLLSAKNVFDDGIHIGSNESEISYSDYTSIVANGYPQRNDVLLCCVGTIGRCCVYDFEKTLAFQRSVSFLRPLANTVPSFLKYALQSDSTTVQEQLLLNKSAQEGLYMGSVREMVIAMPDTVSEQRAIADFLDTQCAKIDSMIADIEKQIETLQKYKKSLITEAVTKGLDRSAPMKDSEIEWIGFIPEKWDCKKLKYIISEPLQYGANESGDDYREGHPRYIRITDITEENTLKEEGKLSLPPDIAAPYILRDGDILFARSGATVGKSFFYTTEYGLAAFAGYLIRAKINQDMALPKFVYYSTLGIGYENWKNTVFTQATIQNIGADKYAQFYVTLPGLEEQSGIVEYLDEKCARIDDVVKNKQAQLFTMQQHKKSLIYEYVTGKKRVTEVN